MSKKFGPKSEGHPSIGTPCPICGIPFKEGDYTALACLDNEENKQRYEEETGDYYNAVCAELHWDCFEKVCPNDEYLKLEEKNSPEMSYWQKEE